MYNKKEYHKLWCDKNKGKLRKYTKTFIATNPTYYQEYRNAHREQHKEYMKEYGPMYQKTEKWAAYMKKYRQRVRHAIISAYSNGTNSCAICGYNKDVRALDLDHINGGGNKERKELAGDVKYPGSRGGVKLYGLLYKNNFPNKDKYRILCCNCNRISHLDR